MQVKQELLFVSGIKNIKLKCEHSGCDFETDDYGEMRKHFEAHAKAAKTSGPLKCDLLKSSDIYSRKSNVRNVKECPFCKAFTTQKNDRLINHIKKSHSDVTVEQMHDELKKIIGKGRGENMD